MNKKPHNNKIDDSSVPNLLAGENLRSEIQKDTQELKNFNDRVEKDLEEIHKELQSKKKTELSESVQLAHDSKELDDIEKEFDTGLINIYADVVDKIGDDNL